MKVNTFIHIFLIGFWLAFCIYFFDAAELILFGDEINYLYTALSYAALISCFAIFEIIIFPIVNIILIPLRILTLGLISLVLSVVFTHFFVLSYPYFEVSSLIVITIIGLGLAGIRKATTLY